MKKLLLAAVVMALFATSSFAQQGKISFGVGADVALPMSSGFSDGWGLGIGGTARGYYQFNDMVTFTATAGYMTFSGKDIPNTTLKNGSWSMIPVLVGGRYYFTPATPGFRPYAAFEMGLIFSSYEIPGFASAFGISGSVSGSDFSYQPAVGFEASKFDVSVRLLGVSSATCVAFRAGYIFN